MRIIKWFFLTLGVIFFALIIGAIYFVVKDPFNLRPLFDAWYGNTTDMTIDDADSNTTTTTSIVHPSYLSDSQAKMLSSVGIDPAVLPSEISPAMIECASQKLSEERVAALMNGSQPTMQDLIKAQACITKK